MEKIYVSGINSASKAHFLATYFADNNLNFLFAVTNDDDLDNLTQDVRTFLDGKNIQVLSFEKDNEQERIITLSKISNGKKTIVIADPESLDEKVLSIKALRTDSLLLKTGNSLDHNALNSSLSKGGYSRVSFVEEKGQFSIRGEIIDVWPCDSELPVRISFDFETIETIKTFDYISQRSDTYLNEINIIPRVIGKEASVIAEEIPRGACVYFDGEPHKDYENFNLVINSPLAKNAVHYDYAGFQGFQGDIKYFLDLLKMLKSQNIDIKIYCSNTAEKERIINIFYDNGWQYDDMPAMILLPLWQGFYLKNKLAVLSTKEFLYKRKQINFPKFKSGKRLEGIWEISAGDYVVHEKYGIGKYKGLSKITVDDKTSEYLCIEYRHSDKLYVPPDDFKVVKKYVGVEGVKPKLYSMDTFAWENVKQRARENASEFAKELLELYAKRAKTLRTPFKSSVWEKDLADSFVYDETDDQLKAIEDINNDFSKPYPMERLVCGDVGFGKTEVAIRACFKIVCQSKQVAVLVPTTVLAEQHYNTFMARLSAFPSKIAMLSRFQTVKQQKEIIKEIKNGTVDIVIGTHRLLQKDVEFKKLGLLVIDEEHRFGVKQKEKIKMFKKDIDILMLSATPIPRTLSGALYGLRDLSLIETQPVGRQPIQTTLSLYDKKLIKHVIEAELSRGGQVFYVYNRVETILTKAAELAKIVKDARLAVIHGQMKSTEIEKVMWKFLNKEIDVLLATTIIESGIDIPSVNTMIIEDAENFGLSQLHQLRGRIGRDKQKAYCYLLYKDLNLSDEAVKRLEAMKEFSDLGSGYKLALKDLEIRGAGSILSSKQHGFIRDVGFDMFSKLLEEESKKIKNINSNTQEQTKQIATEIDLNIEAFIPDTYIEDEDIRILFYRKISDITDFTEIEPLLGELTDRFGKLPETVKNLFEVCRLKIAATALKIERLSEDKIFIYVYFPDSDDLKNIDIASFARDYHNEAEFMRGKINGFKLRKKPASDKWAFINTFLENFKKYVK